MSPRPNLVFVFSDQHRAQATGYFGNPDVRTPNLDRFAAESLSLSMAISGAPVCSPARASLLTGQYPLTHGVFVNDVPLNPDANTLGKTFAGAGYRTAYIGKWHVDGHGRSAYIPPERRQGFEYWRVLECTHNYNDSPYYASDAPPTNDGTQPNGETQTDDETQLKWEGYDAAAQTRCAEAYLRDHAARYGSERPFALVLSWGPPHNPYETAPEEYRALYDPEALQLRPNVPPEKEATARRDLAGYYAHITALDDCFGRLWRTLQELGLEDHTILIYTSDHGDMLFSQGEPRKQRPWDESIRVPFLLHFPAQFGRTARTDDVPVNTPDIMPTLLGLCGIEIPTTVEGSDYASYLRTGVDSPADAVLLQCPHPFGEWTRAQGGKEYRGVRTRRYTYVRDLDGPWLLYDNERDPYQVQNLVNRAEHQDLQQRLEERLQAMLAARGDKFEPSQNYIDRWGYVTNPNGTVPYRN